MTKANETSGTTIKIFAADARVGDRYQSPSGERVITVVRTSGAKTKIWSTRVADGRRATLTIEGPISFSVIRG